MSAEISLRLIISSKEATTAMLQNFLLQFIPAMEEGLTLGAPLAILLVILQRIPVDSYRSAFRAALKWGFWLSVFIVAVRVGTRNAISREILEGFSTAVTLIAESIILARLFSIDRISVDRPLKFAITAAVLTLFLYHGFELWLIPVGSIIAALGDYTTVNFLIKILGFISGAAFAFISSFLIYKAADALNDQRLKFVFIVQIAVCMLQQIIFLIQVLMARGVLDGELTMSIMAPIINNQSSLIFVIFAAILVVPITLFSQPRPEKPEGANPAQYRSLLAKALHKRRWGMGVVAALVLMTTTSSAGSYIANQKEEIVAAIPVNAVNGSVDVEIETINDGHLHRFVYGASTGEQVRYIVILKGGSAYGVGLDACEICGATGYFERDSQVICKLCDVQMNKATIGTRGGCNPIPIEYRIEDGRLKVPQSELENAAKIFQ